MTTVTPMSAAGPIQTTFDFRGRRGGAGEGGRRFREAAALKATWNPGERAAVLDAVAELIAEADRPPLVPGVASTVDADRVRLRLEARGLWDRMHRNHAAMGTTLGSLARTHVLERCGMRRSAIPENKSREIRIYRPGRRWHEIEAFRARAREEDDRV